MLTLDMILRVTKQQTSYCEGEAFRQKKLIDVADIFRLDDGD